MAASNDVIKAMSILFGDEFFCSENTLQYIQPSGIKKAFRSKALLYHPDHASKATETEVKQVVAFHELQDAYQLLMDLKQKKICIQQQVRQSTPNHSHPTARSRNVKKSPRPQQKRADRDFFYSGKNLPHATLRIGEFLYYSGRISWHTLIDAIVEQRRCGNRLFGEYFIKQNILTRAELMRTLQQMRRHNFSLKGA